MSQNILTNGLNHASLSCVRLHWNDILEAMQRDNALLGVPHLKNVLHFGAQCLSQSEERDSVSLSHFTSYLFTLCSQRLINTHSLTLEVFSPL